DARVFRRCVTIREFGERRRNLCRRLVRAESCLATWRIARPLQSKKKQAFRSPPARQRGDPTGASIRYEWRTPMSTSPDFVTREVERLVSGAWVSDGAGVKLLRALTPDLQRRLDPFLLLDEFRSDNPDDYLAGFPDHPHRGFETVT